MPDKFFVINSAWRRNGRVYMIFTPRVEI